MKKMNLKHLNLSGAELLNRDELKKILGGKICGSNWESIGGGSTCSLTFLRINSWELAMYLERSCNNGVCDTTAPPGHVLADQSPCFSNDVGRPCH
ncbi:hypothetical protein CMT42_13310 [Elizabethkingia anophelis]|uniref:Uncharacterized protein n=2 Tax=Elizabethkingia anophelis TaxID=1117645 RepID=A0A1T3GZ93_9FLAO|nr:hypothetical protein BBD31_04310 [Elizabethkingia anophelis]AQX49411.1 hypothetical protein AYC66_01380 [Elizabethkingia anophelis]AQX87757.1 hypothetical protein AYC67_01380 [Elizabethkingia anophelis]ASV80303.1 hypothetical protein A6J37_17750 [Elizabethkingia anophelis]MDV2444297.1 hypothetical protein [Elizabethkingia anophelis]